MSLDWPPKSNYYHFHGKQLLAIDYGEKVTGTSTFRAGHDPFPLLGERIVFKGQNSLVKEIVQMVKEHSIEAIVLGLPLYTDGKESEMTLTVKKFYAKLLESLTIPCYLQDETLSSVEAKNRMLNSPRFNFKVDLKEIDNVAASIILEDFLKNDHLNDH